MTLNESRLRDHFPVDQALCPTLDAAIGSVDVQRRYPMKGAFIALALGALVVAAGAASPVKASGLDLGKLLGKGNKPQPEGIAVRPTYGRRLIGCETNIGTFTVRVCYYEVCQVDGYCTVVRTETQVPQL